MIRRSTTALVAGLFLLGHLGPATAEMSDAVYQDFLETAQGCGRAQPRERACGGEQRFPDAVRQSFMERARGAGASESQMQSLNRAWDDAAREMTERLGQMEVSCPSPPPSGPSPLVAACGGE